MKILSVSDVVNNSIYSTQVKKRFPDIDLVLGCGDLPYYYLEFIIDMLNVPVYFVRGNHAPVIEYSKFRESTGPQGAIDLNGKIVNHRGLLMVGFEGSIRYKPGPFQYSQWEMWLKVFSLLPQLVFNRIMYGRFLDILISHSPPWQINDRNDLPHQGFKALRWFLSVFKPKYHFHGHIHIYDRNTKKETDFLSTKVINTYGYIVTEMEIDLPNG